MSLPAFKGRIISFIAEELQKSIPQFRPYTEDYQIVLYVYQDFETWIRTKWGDNDPRMISKLERCLQEESGELTAFLSFWLSIWVEKWRERVEILSRKPKLPKGYLKYLKRARRFYREMEQRQELKNMVVRRLINQGEICMVEPIAETLILQEIMKNVQSVDEEACHMKINALDILNNLSQRISGLPKEKGPLIYLEIKTYMI